MQLIIPIHLLFHLVVFAAGDMTSVPGMFPMSARAYAVGISIPLKFFVLGGQIAGSLFSAVVGIADMIGIADVWSIDLQGGGTLTPTQFTRMCEAAPCNKKQQQNQRYRSRTKQSNRKALVLARAPIAYFVLCCFVVVSHLYCFLLCCWGVTILLC